MPQPSAMQTTAVITSVKNSVIALASKIDAGSTLAHTAEKFAAAPVMMLDSLKPTPVSVTTPMMTPTVAAAAPTPMAYFAPTTNESSMSNSRSLAASSLRMNQADTASEAPMIRLKPSHSVRISRRTHAATATRNATATIGLRFVSPRTMQPVMPQKAARYGVKPENSTISSTASGMAVGQSRRMTAVAEGSSDRGSPSSPYFFASK